MVDRLELLHIQTNRITYKPTYRLSGRRLEAFSTFLYFNEFAALFDLPCTEILYYSCIIVARLKIANTLPPLVVGTARLYNSAWISHCYFSYFILFVR